ncbi:dicarboxylate transporter/tellurite-resistance protein TehA [soil metagenome]
MADPLSDSGRPYSSKVVAMKMPVVPAAFFGMVLGLIGLGGAWRVAHRVWQLPAVIGESIMACGSMVWAIVMILFALKWLMARDAALTEARHPVQCCFIGLAGVSTMLVALAVLPYSPTSASVMFVAGATFTIVFAVWRTGLLWQGGRDPATTTPVLYLPTVAGGFVTAIGASTLGQIEWAQLAFGVGLLSWLAIESVLLHRLYTLPSMPPPLRPTLGVQLAPPAVGAVAWLSVNGGAPDLVAHALVGYALLQILLMLRLARWIHAQPFSPAYWSFTFGVTALATAGLQMVEAGDAGAVASLAPWLFAGANLLVVAISIGTLWLMVAGRLIPPSSPALLSPQTPAPTV